MRNIIYALSVAILMGGFCVSCAESDDFSSDKSLKLSFSRDTISFDTVFTTVGSSVVQFKIYNRNNKSLSIETIEVMNPEKSGFSMNIDGEIGARLTDIDILKKDSLYGFLRVTVDPLDATNPVLIRDSIRFTTNGNVQYIILEAIGRDVCKLYNIEIKNDTSLSAEKPYLIYDTLKVNKGATLTIEGGAELYFHNKASLHVWGSLNVNGRLGEKVVFRGDRSDMMNGSVPYDNVPGQWEGIVFHPESYNNRLTNLVIRNAVRGIDFKPSDITYKKATLQNLIVHNSSEYCILVENCKIDAVNCQLTNARKSVLNIIGGSYSFLHCTIANYYQWSNREGVTLSLNNSSQDKDSELVQCIFINSIIYGSRLDEFSINNKSGVGFNYNFRNCLIRNRQEFSGVQFVNMIWNQNPNFFSINNTGLYDYNFDLTETSAALDKADITHSSRAPYDLHGKARLSDAAPDLGCYEWLNNSN